MSERGELLRRYLRQQAELAGGRIFLDELSAAQALAALDSPIPALSAPASATGAARAPAAPTSAARPRPVATPAPTPDAAPASGLAALREQVMGCTACVLHRTRTQVVFGEGSETAEVVVVGEAPGQEEDRTGRPFVGRAGKLLDLLLLTAGLAREQVFICNVLKCRPPENRNPLPAEMEACARHLHGQLEQIAPRVLLAVGKFAAQLLTQSEESISRLRGRIFSYRGTPLVVSYHPAYLLRSPQMTRTAWEDFQLLRRVLHEHR